MKNDVQLKEFPVALLPYKQQIEQTYKQSYHISFSPLENEKGLYPIQMMKEQSMVFDCNGDPIYLLAQIDFSLLTLQPPFPNSGVLQIFVNKDFGNKSSRIEEEAFAIQFNLNSDCVTHLIGKKYSHLYQCISFTGETKYEPVSAYDYRFHQHFTNVHTIISEDEQSFFDHYVLQFSGAEHKIGGYPYFIKEDFRIAHPHLRKYDTLLLQLVSDDSIGFEYRDSGVISFFINHDALARRDFSDVYLHTENY